MLKKHAVWALMALVIAGQEIKCGDQKSISSSILDLYAKMSRSLNREEVFIEKFGIKPSGYFGCNLFTDRGNGLGLEVTIYGTRAELSRPSTAGFNQRSALRASILLAIERNRSKEQQKMIDDRVFEPAVHFSVNEKYYRHELDPGVNYDRFDSKFSSEDRDKQLEVKLDDKTKCTGPAFYQESLGLIRCKMAYRAEDLDKL